MTDDKKLALSRRKLLGGLGAVGLAGAGAGLGTTALFNDEESFENNSITAGTLDMKVGWEEHYFKGKQRLDYSGSTDVSKSDVQYVDGSPASGRTTLPLDATSPQDGAAVSVPDSTTALGLLDVTEVDEWPSGFDPSDASGDPCNYLAEGAEQSPVIIDLDDVKPGDFGEITFSLALCDNPGYLWLQGCLQDAAENGVNEPEASSNNEDQEEGSGDPALKTGSGNGTVELLDEVQAAWWYDDGDNLQSGGAGGGGGAVDLVIVFDTSGSMDDQTNKLQNAKDGAKTLVDAVGSNVNVGLVDFDSGATVVEDLGTSKSTVKSTIDTFAANGGTDIDTAIDTAQTELTGTNGDPNADKVMVVLSNGSSSSGSPRSAATTAKNGGTTIYSIAYGNANEDLMEDISSGPKQDDGTIDSNDDKAFIGSISTIETVFQNVGGQISGGEELINAGSVQAQGSLREILNELCPDQANDDYGLPLDGDRSTQFDEQNEPVNDSDREAFSASTRHDIGFAWWVPRSVGNQIQSDSATFSLGFYAVQSRNNDGSGSA